MKLERHLEGLQDDLSALGALTDESTAGAVRRLTAAGAPALRLRLLDMLEEAAHELDAQFEGRVELRLAGGEPRLVLVPPDERAPASAASASDDDAMARVSLRLPESLKVAAEAAAAAAATSLNTWLVRTIASGLAGDRERGFGAGRRLTGFGRS